MADGFHSYAPNIFVLDKNPSFRKEVVLRLDRLKTTQSGKALLKYIEAKDPLWIAIFPFKPTADNPVNASAEPNSPGSSPVGHLWYMEMKLPDGSVMRLPYEPGTGTGSCSYVKYHPASWTESNRRMGRVAPGDGPSEVLFHELVHSTRHLNGTLTKEAMVGLPAGEDIEEFYAILAANIYRSERGFTSLRKDHDSSAKMEPIDAIDSNYYDEYKVAIDKWFTTDRQFCMAMAKVSAKFNPLTVAAVELGLMPQPTVPMSLPGG